MPGLNHAAILSAMNAREQDFREDVLAQQLVDSLDSPVRLLLGRLLLMALPVPRDVVAALAPGMDPFQLDAALLRAASLSLLDTYREGGQTLYRTPRQLSRGPILRSPCRRSPSRPNGPLWPSTGFTQNGGLKPGRGRRGDCAIWSSWPDYPVEPRLWPR